jgi:putative acyl-CoA dehydrogenase
VVTTPQARPHAPDSGGATTHEVTNQPPPLQGHDLYGTDAVLREAVEREGAAWAHDRLHELGTRAGGAEAIGWGFAAEASPPVLHTHDRFGHRIDEVTYHPAYHALMDVAVGSGLHAAPWTDPTPGTHVARAAGFLIWSQVEPGHLCPISMTYAAVPALRAQPELARAWVPALAARRYDPTLGPVADKPGALAGMAMTEKQGGSDVRANTTRAVPGGPGTPGTPSGPGAEHRLTGHKWFCSAPMSDVFLMLAQAPGGLSCFGVPRVLPDGSRNAIRLQRLKDKLGNRSNASAEIELDGACGWMVGDEGRGVRTIVEMVTATRLDCVLGTAALIRQASVQAVHHARHRSAFGRRLADQPLMQAVLADLAVESEAATSLALRLAGAMDRSQHGEDEQETMLRRIGTAVAKYWVCKRGPTVVGEALECLGGNGYVEESGLPRLYREAPVNSVWEGSGNVNALDVLRALARTPATADALLAEVDTARGGDRRLDDAADALRRELGALVVATRRAGDGDAAAASATATVERGARRLVERMALTLQGALLVRHAPSAVADAFCASRLAGDWGHTLGTLPVDADDDAILTRFLPG